MSQIVKIEWQRSGIRLLLRAYMQHILEGVGKAHRDLKNYPYTSLHRRSQRQHWEKWRTKRLSNIRPRSLLDLIPMRLTRTNSPVLN